MVLRRQFLPKCRDHSGRNAAVKAQPNAGMNSRTMPALGLSILVYGGTIAARARPAQRWGQLGVHGRMRRGMVDNITWKLVFWSQLFNHLIYNRQRNTLLVYCN